MRTTEVLVVGAGITGAATAWALAEAGLKVEVIDAYGPAAMASGWTLAGVRQSGRHLAELPLARAAVRLWPELAERLGSPVHYRQEGNLRLARTDDEVAIVRKLVETQTAAGLALTFLPSAADVRAVAPALSPDIRAASFCPTDGHADPNATVGAFLAAAQRHGARLTFGDRVARFESANGRITHAITTKDTISPGAVVLACGVDTNRLLASFGQTIPLRVPIVTVVQTNPLPAMLRPVLGVANADMAVRQEVSGALRMTSGAEPFAGERAEVGGRPVVRPRAGALRNTIARVSAVLPAVCDAEVAAIWGGLLDLTPDALPVIDRVCGMENAAVAAGFSGHGFGIGPITGQLVADLVLHQAPRLPLDAFQLARFSSRAAGIPESLTLHG